MAVAPELSAADLLRLLREDSLNEADGVLPYLRPSMRSHFNANHFFPPLFNSFKSVSNQPGPIAAKPARSPLPPINVIASRFNAAPLNAMKGR